MSGMARMTGVQHNKEVMFYASNSVNTDKPKPKRPSRPKKKKVTVPKG